MKTLACNKYFFLISSLGGGGAENVLVTLVNRLAEKGYKITVQVLFSGGVHENELSPNITLIHTNCWLFKQNSIHFLTRLKFFLLRIMPSSMLYQLVIKNDADVEIAYIEGLPTKIISGSKKKSRKYAWVHIDPSFFSYSSDSYLLNSQENAAYKKFDNIFCVSSNVRNSFRSIYGVNADVMYNAIDRNRVIELANKPNDFSEHVNSYFVSSGRLVKQKRFDRIIKLFARLKKEGYRFHLIILGDGILKDELKQLIYDNDLQTEVEMYGYVKEPYNIIKGASCFICSSEAEGMSTAVTEAIILGVPVVTTDCAGMRDIFGDTNCGMIVPNSEEGLYFGIKKILDDNAILDNMRIAAKERSQYFDLDANIDLFLENVK